MFVAHAPAGYLIGAALDRRRASRVVLAWSVVGALVPDLDMFYFVFVDGMRVNHHHYATHTLPFWALLCGLLAPLALRWPTFGRALLGFFLGTGSHVVLDTPTGGIMWGYPLDRTLQYLIIVEPRLPPHSVQHVLGVPVKGWVINMMTHWTMAFEGLILFAAALTFLVRRARSAPVVTEQT